MNQTTKEMISKNRLLEKPVYSEEDLKILEERLMFISKDTKAWNIIIHIRALDYNPILFEGWADQANDDYDYKAIFFESSMDKLPMILCEDLDSIEDIVLRWRLERSK
jgi:hypothetical protein